MTKPTTADTIRTTIDDCKTRILLEQMTIDALERDLKKFQNQLGDADRLFCRTKDIDQQIVGKKKE